jgi:peroxiredoxin Q/BCP
VLEVGDRAPEIELPDQTGATHLLSEHRGAWVVVYFYPQDDTPGCTTQACGVRDAWGELRDVGLDVVGISPDAVDSHAAFAEKHDLPFPLLADPEREVMTAWGAWGTKVLYGREVTGTIRCAFLLDPDGVVRKVWKRVSTGTFAANVGKAHAKLAG